MSQDKSQKEKPVKKTVARLSEVAHRASKEVRYRRVIAYYYENERVPVERVEATTSVVVKK